MKKIVSFLLIAALVLSLVPFSAFAQKAVASISYTTEYHDLIEDADGEWDNEDDYFRYSCNFHVGDQLTVNYSSGESKLFTAEFIDGELYFTAENAEPIRQWDDIVTSHNQRENHWVVGGEYTYSVEYMGKQTNVAVRVVENPVNSISYTPKAGYVKRYFEAGGSFDIDEEGNEYYRYSVPERSNDDVLTVNYGDGRGTVDYKLTYNPTPMYVSTVDSNDIIPENQVEMFDEQWSEPFELGDNNYFYVRYMGKRASVQVRVFNNPISDIVYTPVGEIKIYEHTNGWWDTDEFGQQYYRYNAPWFSAGDKLAVTYSDNGNTVVYTYLDYHDYENDREYRGFYDGNFEQLPDENVYVSNDGDWELGDSNFMYVRYMDNESNRVRVIIEKNPVKAIVFERAKDVTIVENTHMYHDDWDGRDYYNIPYHQNGDKLTIIDNDDNETVYEYQDNGVYASDGKDDIPSYDVHFNSDQRDNPWGLGQHEYIVEYLGREYALTATIIESNVKAIRYERAEKQEYFENTNGDYDQKYGYYHYWYSWYQDGDKLIVINTNDNETVYEYKLTGANDWERAFISDNNDIIDANEVRFDDEQYINHWQVGDDNEYTVEYLGAKYTLYATIKYNPVKAIRFEPVTIPTVMVGVRSYYDQNIGTEIFYEPSFNEGDRLTVIDKDDNEKVYTAGYDERHDIVFKATDGDEINAFDVSLDSRQWEQPWTVGGDNEYTVVYMNAEYRVKCQVVENPVDSIEFIPAEITTYLEGTNMYYDEWREQSVYEMPRVNNGDILVVHYKDPARGRVEYTATFDNANDRMTYVSNDGDIIVEDEKLEFNDEQDFEPWSVGENHYSIIYCGKATQVLVVIKENNIAGISYTSVRTPQVWITDYNMDTDEETGMEYKHYNIPDFQEGDILTITDKFGDSVDYVLTFDENDGERYFVNGDEKYHQYTLMCFDNQYEREWALGRGNYYSVDFYGFTANIEVEIIETDVESISFTPVNEIVIESEKDGEFIYDDHGEKFYLYNRVRIINAGDTLTVTYKNGEIVVYTLSDDDTGENWILRADDGREIDPQEIDIDDHQWDNHWRVGTNHFDIVYHGVRASADVTIKGSYIPGDINGDEKVNNKDLTRLFQYLSDWDVEVNEQARDVNGDGKVNNKDLTRLFQYLSDWDVEIF